MTNRAERDSVSMPAMSNRAGVRFEDHMTFFCADCRTFLVATRVSKCEITTSVPVAHPVVVWEISWTIVRAGF